MGLTLLVALLSHAAGEAPDRPAAAVMVADVTVEGNNVITTDRIMSYLKTRPGTKLSRDRLLEDLRKLMKLNAFRSIRPVVKDLPDGRVQVHFIVEELPNLRTIQDIVFENARHLNDKELLNLTGLKTGVPLSIQKNREACTEIEQALRQQGRAFAKVTLEEGGGVTDRRVVFKIEEGPVVRVAHVRIEDDSNLIGSKELVGHRGKLLNYLELEVGAFCITQHLQKQGVADVTVATTIKLLDDYHVDVIYHVGRDRSADTK